MLQIIKKVANRFGWLIITAGWLYTFSFIFTNYFSSGSSAQKASVTIEKYIENQEHAYSRIVNDTATLAALINENGNSIKKQLLNDDLGIFIYQVNDLGHPVLIYWNSSKMVVENSDLNKIDGSYAVNYQNGAFELIKKSIIHKGAKYICCGLVPVQWKYFLENEYLKTNFAASSDFNSAFELTGINSNSSAIRNSSNKVLFYIAPKKGVSLDRPGGFSIFLRIIAVLLLMIFVHAVAEEIVKHKGFVKGVSFLIGVVFFIRLITYYLPFPFDYSKFELFSPIIYASSNVHPSLGDLLINCLLFFWIIAFVRKHFLQKNFLAHRLLNNKVKIIPFLAMPFLGLITLYVASLIISLVTDSTISLEAANFYSLNNYTFTCFLIICLLMYGWFYLSSFCILISGNLSNHFFWQLTLVTASSLLIISLGMFSVSVPVSLLITLWLIIYVFILSKFGNNTLSSFATSPAFIFRAVFLIASAVSLISYQNTLKEKQTRIRIAEKLEMQTDPGGESLIKLAITNFSDIFLQNNFYRFENENENKFLKDSLINENFIGYLNKYDTRIYTFNNKYQPLFNDDSALYSTIKSIILTRSKPTSTEGLYFNENSQNRFSYIYEKTVLFAQDSSIAGYIFAIAQPKIYRKEALTPELFKQVNDVMGEMNQSYAYALYNNMQLTKSFNNFNFSDKITKNQLPKAGYSFRNNKSYNELWFNTGRGGTIVIVKKNNWFVNGLTLFAYNFIIFIFLALLIHVGNLIIQNMLLKKKFIQLFQANILTRIQLTIISVSILSFTIIGAATISFFILRFNNNNRNHLASTSEVILNEVRNMINNQLVFDDAFSLNELGIQSDLTRKISELAEVHHIDINFFSPSGLLLVSSQPYIYNKQIISNQMPPKAYYNLHYMYSTELFEKEKIGSFSYLGIYVPVKDENSNIIAYLNIPYLNSQNELKAEISNFLITLINLNALIFILAGAIALSLTEKITSSFELIGKKMREIALGKTNEAIEWNTNDEIGILVNEYNIMVNKLEQSADALAKSEREGAWREMARQVAHEIKNPLTPMKLSIQYLQKAIYDNAPNTKELALNVADTLVEQINQLSKIAGDFSQFANIGNIKPEVFNLSEMLKALVNLYSTDSSLYITFVDSTSATYLINNDKIQINRLFTNLIKNAIEASNSQYIINIFINLYFDNNFLITEIKDEGAGIEAGMQAKIFEPNFTTKSSGTGLGLAICKAITENANGRIWYTTKPGRGSTFFVALPVFKN